MNAAFGSSSVAQSIGTDEMPGSIHSGERSANAVYIGGEGNCGPVRTGCIGSEPVLSAMLDPTRACIVTFGSMRVCSCVLTEANGVAPVPPSDGGSGTAADCTFRYPFAML